MSDRPDIIHECATAMRGSKAWPAVFESGSAEVLTEAALAVLRRRGMLNELGIAAVKEAEARRQ